MGIGPFKALLDISPHYTLGKDLSGNIPHLCLDTELYQYVGRIFPHRFTSGREMLVLLYNATMWYSFAEPCIQRSGKKRFTTWKLKLQDLKGKAAQFYSWGSIIIPWNFKSGLEQELPTVSVGSVSPQSGRRHISPLRTVGILFQRQCGIRTFKSFVI